MHENLVDSLAQHGPAQQSTANTRPPRRCGPRICPVSPLPCCCLRARSAWQQARLSERECDVHYFCRVIDLITISSAYIPFQESSVKLPMDFPATAATLFWHSTRSCGRASCPDTSRRRWLLDATVLHAVLPCLTATIDAQHCLGPMPIDERR
eukprot:6206704-Pleurochrysis_carterae.AAC.5